METVNRWLRMGEACRYARVSRKMMRRLIEDGSISCGHTPGGHRRIDRESIDAHFTASAEKDLAFVRSLRL